MPKDRRPIKTTAANDTATLIEMANDVIVCPTCDGHGETSVNASTPNTVATRICPRCDGTGVISQRAEADAIPY